MIDIYRTKKLSLTIILPYYAPISLVTTYNWSGSEISVPAKLIHLLAVHNNISIQL